MNTAQTMQLIISLTSPYARKARIMASENHITIEVKVDVPWNEDTGVIAFNPLGKVPILIRENGQPLFDSRVICEYLDMLGTARLIPDSPSDRIAVKQWEALADGIMDAALMSDHIICGTDAQANCRSR